MGPSASKDHLSRHHSTPSSNTQHSTDPPPAIPSPLFLSTITSPNTAGPCAPILLPHPRTHLLPSQTTILCRQPPSPSLTNPLSTLLSSLLLSTSLWTHKRPLSAFFLAPDAHNPPRPVIPRVSPCNPEISHLLCWIMLVLHFRASPILLTPFAFRPPPCHSPNNLVWCSPPPSSGNF